MLNSDERSELAMMGMDALSSAGDWVATIPAPGLADLVAIGVGATLLFLAWYKLKYPRGRDRARNPLGLPGKLVYADTGEGSEVFRSEKYGLSAKPDFILKLKNKAYVLVEYKGRDSNEVFSSDIVQAKAAVLAARTKYPVSSAFVVTEAGHCVQVPLGTSDEVHQSIAFVLDKARNMKERGEI